MHITRIELENIKSYTDAHFELTTGTTAITGENGAGKTTLIEAIAWTLFDHLDYKKDEFMRRGTKKGSARVSFVSSSDEREYTVYRDTGTGYYVFDPRLRLRVADKKEEVLRFLWQHLGVEPGTDLSMLFRQAIGVPQGTYTAIFLAPATERKRTFDTLIKVEEYRRGSEILLDTKRYLDNQMSELNVRIARSEGEIADVDTVEQELSQTMDQINALSADIALVSAAIGSKTDSVNRLDEKLAELESLRRDLAEASAALKHTNFVFLQAVQEQDSAAAAAKILASVEDGRAKHLATIGSLRQLDDRLAEQSRLRREFDQLQADMVNFTLQTRTLEEKLKNIDAAKESSPILISAAEQQQQIEIRLQTSRIEFAAANAAADELARVNQRLADLRTRFAERSTRLKAAELDLPLAADVERLQKEENAAVAQLAQLRAALERDEKFQSEIKNGLCPILSQRCLNLKDGETLENYVASQFTEYKEEIAAVENRKADLAVKLVRSRQAERSSASIDDLRSEVEATKAEGTRIKAEAEALEAKTASRPAIEASIKADEELIKQLGDPRAQLRSVEAQIAEGPEIQDRLKLIAAENADLLDKRSKVERSLALHDGLDAERSALAAERDRTLEAYQTYLANETVAANLVSATEKADRLAADLERIEAAAAIAQKKFSDAETGYDANFHSSEKELLRKAEQERTALSVRLEGSEKDRARLQQRIERFAEIRLAVRDEYREKEKVGRVSDAVTFIRDTLKEAAPKVAKNYVYHVSAEANQTFREITGDPERTLRWTEEYAIMLEEKGYERPFASLSGGEQMAAALSVRLSLLKQLSDIRIAFFDEPTTNLDAERRENLADQISRITNFDQILVISHDDTFEGYMDSEITIENERS